MHFLSCFRCRYTRLHLLPKVRATHTGCSLRPQVLGAVLTGLAALNGCLKLVPAAPDPDDAGLEASLPAESAEGTTDLLNQDAASARKPCLDDLQCDDTIDCTQDRCDLSVHRCESVPNHDACQNDRYCDGTEVCDLRRGCIAGLPVTCSDTNPCTIDRCIEATRSCVHDRRDVDGDGDFDGHCREGHDCDDQDPFVNSKASEVCTNGRDDNCDGTIDEQTCVAAAHDTCLDPMAVMLGSRVQVDTRGSTANYASNCVQGVENPLRDVVASVRIPDDATGDLVIVATTPAGQIWIDVATGCEDASSRVACGVSGTPTSGGRASKAIVRAASPGLYFVRVFVDLPMTVSIHAELKAPEPKPLNETCGKAEPLTIGALNVASILDATRDLPTACAGAVGDLVYGFSLAEPNDIRVFAQSTDGLGQPILSLRNSACASLLDELVCSNKQGGASIFRRALPAGSYFLGVGASGPTSVKFQLDVEPPSQAPADGSCDLAPALDPNRTISVSLNDHTDAIAGTCLAGAVEAVYAVDVSEPSDIMLVGRFSRGDNAAVSLFRPRCELSDRLACATSPSSPVRVTHRAVAAGSYRAIIETIAGHPTQLTAFVRPAKATTDVFLADRCVDAIVMDQDGGFFQGNTSSSMADYAAACDSGGGGIGGAPDQMLKLLLTQPRRVVLELVGADFRPLLSVRRGPSCPGTETWGRCTAGFDQRAYLDLVLEAGTHFVQIDGLGSEKGAWTLDVYTAPP